MALESLTTLDGWFKRRYADRADRPIPEFAILQKDIPFKSRPKLGDDYQITVRVRRSFGWTWAGRDSGNAGSVYTLTTPVAGQTKPARVNCVELVDRIQIPYGAVTKASDSEDSFGDIFDELVMTMEESAYFAKEMAMMYAGTHIGQIEADPGTGPGDRTVTITKATFCQGLWAQAEGMPIDVYDSTLTTLRNAVSGDISIASFDGTRSGITLTGTEASLDDIQINDVILPKGAKGEWSGANTAGIKKILENTGSLFGISAATYGMWKATRVDAGSQPLTLTLLNRAASNALGRGGLGPFRFYVSHFGWTDLNVDHAELRRTNEKEGKDLVIGSEKIAYIGPCGMMEIVPHPMLMAGEAWGLRLPTWEHGGAMDYGHRLPGSTEDNPRFFDPNVTDKSAVELRGMADFYPALCRQPVKQVQIHTIVNNSLA